MYQSGIRDIMQVNSIEKSPSNLEFSVPSTTRFNPLNYNMIAWWDFNDSSSVISDANGISQCNDRSPNGYHLVQADNTKKPAYVNVNGVYVARFDGVNDILSVNFGKTFPQPMTIFIIWKITTAGAVNSVQAPLTMGWYFDHQNTATPYIRLDGGTTVNAYTKTLPFNYMYNTLVINGSSTKIYENGILKNTINPGTTYTTSAAAVGGVKWSTSRTLNGDVAEVICLSSLITDYDISLFERYLFLKTLQLIG